MNQKQTQLQRLNDIEALLRDGKIPSAQKLLRELKWKQLIGGDRVKFATLARRAGVPNLTLRSLSTTVYPSGTAPSKQHSEEKIEYAAALISLRALEEGGILLSSIDSKAHPRALLYRSFVHIARWEYEESIPLLQQLILSEGVPPKEKLTAEINLAAGLIDVERLSEAESVLEAALRDCELQQFAIARGHVFQLYAQLCIKLNQLAKAKSYLAQAHKQYAAGKELDQLFIRKWEAVCELASDAQAGIVALRKVRQTAELLRHFETVRDCDFREAIATKSVELASRLYFGTQLSHYRKRLERHFPELRSSLDTFEWKTADRDISKKIDLAKVDKNGTLHGLDLGKANQRLLSFLLSDFYVPPTAAAICEQVFDQKHFSPLHSVHRVEQALVRLRREIKKHLPQLKVETIQGTYRLVAAVPVQIRIPKFPLVSEKSTTFIQMAKSRLSGRAMTVTSVAEVMKEPKWQVIRYLTRECDLGNLQKLGQGRATHYVAVAACDKKAA